MRHLFSLLLLLFLAGCRSAAPEIASTASASPVASETSTPTPENPPSVVIDTPPSNSIFGVGERVIVQSTANDGIGIARIELLVNGEVVRVDQVPEGKPQPQFSLLQPWEPTNAGEHTLRVIAYRADGTASEPATIVIVVEEAPVAATDNNPAPSPCTVTASTSLNVRAGPGASYGPQGVLSMGESATVTGKFRDGSWWQIEYAGDRAWVAASHSYTDGTCADVEVVAAPALPEGVVHTATASPTAGGPTATTTPSITPGGPTLTPSATPSVTPTPSYTPTPTPSITPGGPTLTPSATPSSTPTLSPTPTSAGTSTATPTRQATNTPTATASATPTVTPAAQVAGEDARFNNPLVIPLDNTASVLDFVSYPDGDREDRVRWDITDMNPNAGLSGGRARLVIAVSCFGTNTVQVEIFTGGQTFSCGQTIVDREVTYDSRTGSVIITAVGGQGTYVQWVLTGTATRLN